MLPLSPGHILQMRREALGIRSGALSVGLNFMDRLMGGEGFPRRSFLEITGDAGSGKTTLALQMAAGVQAQGRHCLWVDAECALDFGYARRLGVDTSSLLVTRCGDGDSVVRILSEFVASDEVELIVIDTLSALPSRDDLKKGVNRSETHMARMRRWVRYLAEQKEYGCCCTLILSQMRDVPLPDGGAMRVSASGCLDDFCETRIELEKKRAICSGNQRIGTEIDLRVVRDMRGGEARHSLRPLMNSIGFIDEEDFRSDADSGAESPVALNAIHRR